MKLRALLVSGALLLLAAGPAAAQSFSHDHPEGADPYATWQQPGNGMSCCSGKDCGPWPATDVDPRSNGGYYLRSLKLEVTADRVLPSPDGRYHVCCRRSSRTGPCDVATFGRAEVYCIAAPTGF
ncbi:MAG: hypothetical protein U1E46_14855 [Hyphomicrobiales bacterium]